LPGVLGNPKSLENESFNSGIQNSKFKIQNSFLEHPQYTKPEEFEGWKVPKILLSGNHKEIKEWREKQSKNSPNF
jgi:tRNA (guanine-N1)-methyltransferase